MSDRRPQRNFLWQGKRFNRTLSSEDKSVKAQLIAERKKKREEKSPIRRRPILLIEYFLKTKRKEKIAVKEKYKVRSLRPPKQELGSSVFLERGLRWQRQ